MELTSVIGLAAAIGSLVFGLYHAGVQQVFLNLHGVVIVLGGTVSAVIFHCQWTHIKAATVGLGRIFKPSPFRDPQVLIPVLTGLAEKARQRGAVMALREAPTDLAGGFMGQAVNIALRNIQNPDMVKSLLDRSIQTARIRNNEVVNVFRAASVLSPMFGLLGTLIGIIQVLRNITSPESVGSAMGTAITSAFYGIGFANLICVPAAGKLRLYAMDEYVAKTLIAEGIHQVVKEELPLQVEQKLWTLLHHGSRNGGGVPAGR
jgi:chemotaxis protein MotA